MRVLSAEHRMHPWVIDQIAPDFTLLDVWALPVEGARDDFERFVHISTRFDPASGGSKPSRALFALRARMGRWLGWDDAPNTRPIPCYTETTLSARLPEYLRDSVAVQSAANTHGFVPIYRTDTEYAAELSNATVHGVLQLTWVEYQTDRYHGRLAVYVKPRGLFGSTYLMLISPFRHLVVYPALTRQIGRAWNARRPVGAETFHR